MYSISDIHQDVKEGMSIEKLHKKYGGTTVYIPKVMPNYKEKIITEFSGDNHAVLAHKYNVSVKTIYEIMKSERKSLK